MPLKHSVAPWTRLVADTNLNIHAQTRCPNSWVKMFKAYTVEAGLGPRQSLRSSVKRGKKETGMLCAGTEIHQWTREDIREKIEGTQKNKMKQSWHAQEWTPWPKTSERGKENVPFKCKKSWTGPASFWGGILLSMASWAKEETSAQNLSVFSLCKFSTNSVICLN